MSRLAIVTAVHSARRSCDIVFTDSWMPVAEVKLLDSLVGSDFGDWDIPPVPLPTSIATIASPPQLPARQIIAVVDDANGRPIVTGFLHPSGGQMAFDQDGRKVYRHASGAYWTISPVGDIELWHPSGTFVRIGAGAAHEPLAQYSVDNAWTEVSTAPAPTISLTAPKISLTIDPLGNVTLNTQASVAIDAPNGVTVTTPTFAVNGQITATGNIIAAFGGAFVDLLNHGHIRGGGTGTSGPPQPGS
jgi:hypothetical protein